MARDPIRLITDQTHCNESREACCKQLRIQTPLTLVPVIAYRISEDILHPVQQHWLLQTNSQQMLAIRHISRCPLSFVLQPLECGINIQVTYLEPSVNVKRVDCNVCCVHAISGSGCHGILPYLTMECCQGLSVFIAQPKRPAIYQHCKYIQYYPLKCLKKGSCLNWEMQHGLYRLGHNWKQFKCSTWSQWFGNCNNFPPKEISSASPRRVLILG